MNSNIKISLHKVLVTLWDDMKNTDWRIEFRYFVTVAIIPSIVIITGLYIFNYDQPLFIGFILGWFCWLTYTSYGTTHESRKKILKILFTVLILTYILVCLQ